VVTLKLGGELTAADLDVRPPHRPRPQQHPGQAHDLPDGPLPVLRTCLLLTGRELQPQVVPESRLQGGVVGLRRGDDGLEQDPPVDRQPPPTPTQRAVRAVGRAVGRGGGEGLNLVGDRDVGVQVGVPGAAVPVGERRPHQAGDVDLPDPVPAGAGAQGVGLDEPQRVRDRSLVGAFDACRDVGWRDRPEGADGLHRREGEVVPGDRRRPRTRLPRDLRGQLADVSRGAAVLGQEELPSHLGPDPPPIIRRGR